MGLSNGVVTIPRFWTELSLMRETSAPESSSASIMLPVVRRRYTNDRGVDDEGWNTFPLDACTSTRLTSPPGSHLLPFFPALLSCGGGLPGALPRSTPLCGQWINEWALLPYRAQPEDFRREHSFARCPSRSHIQQTGVAAGASRTGRAAAWLTNGRRGKFLVSKTGYLTSTSLRNSRSSSLEQCVIPFMRRSKRTSA